MYHLDSIRYKGGEGLARISDEKLNAPFERFDVLELDYVARARDIAIRLSNGEEVGQEEVEYVRLAAVNDRQHLKGDFVISMFLDLVDSGVKFKRWEHGKMIHTNEKEVTKVYRNHFSGTLSVSEFCRQNAMTRNKYYRILKCDVKHPGTKERMEQIKAEIENEFLK